MENDKQSNVNIVNKIINFFPGKTSKKLMGIGGTLILILIGTLTWYHYIATPQYIVSEMVKACQKHDINEFEKYVDIDNLSKSAWSDYKEWREQAKSHIFKVMPKDATSKDSFQTIIKNVINGKKTFDDLDHFEESSEQTVSFAGILSDLHDYKVSNEQDNGDYKTFRITAKTFDEHEFTFDVKMEKRNDNWKITEITNVPELCENFVTFAKESIIDYLKEAQQYQNLYKEQNEKSKKLKGYSWAESRMFGFLNSNVNPKPDASFVKIISGDLKAYLDTRISSEKERVENFSQVKTNKFSDILNQNRINCSKHYMASYVALNEWIDAGVMANSFYSQEVKDIRQKANEEGTLSAKYNERVTALVDAIGYKASKE